ncbi:MAG: hypothetical protein D4R68_02270 [Ignavibacteriales bacterium]|nr:MAG: hypothetical protein D4R68_02270 [Ignavibacteriales bacterium]
MSHINYDIALYNSPFFEDLVSELFRISRYKRNIYKNIRNEEEYKKRLSFEERSILKDLSAKENKIILEILINKHWLDLPSNFIDYFSKNLDEKYNPNFSTVDDKYNNNLNV